MFLLLLCPITMSNKHKHIAFLCGHFKRDKAVSSSDLNDLGWNILTVKDEDVNTSKRFYYPDFVDFCYNHSMDEGCVRYSRQVDKSVNMTAVVGTQEHPLSFIVKEITLYFMPQNMVLYSIHVEQEVSSFEDCSWMPFTLRFIDRFADGSCADFVTLAINPVVEVYNLVKDDKLKDYTCLVENGNKLRVFQIIHSAEDSLTDDKHILRELYELGTFMPVATGGSFVDDALFAEHQNRVIKKSGLTVFPGWSALALQDSFTILASNCENQTENWVARYFGNIYIHALFQKVCLFDFNNRFKRALNKRSQKEVNELVSDYDVFERNCCFNRISYNFLPLLFSDAISDSLEINDEMKQLYRIMAKERSRNEEASRKKMNTLLLAISCLTLFSAIWDACSMLNEMFSFDAHFGSHYLGFRYVVVIMALIVGGGLFYLYKRRRNF